MRVVNLIITIIVEIAMIGLCFLIKNATISSLNSGSFTTLFSLILIAPLFVIPLASALITSLTMSLIALFTKQWAIFVINLIILTLAVYLTVDFLTKVNLK